MNKETTLQAATLHSAMALAFAQIEGATKDSQNPAFKQGGNVSKYADFNSVLNAVKPALIANGLFFTQRCHPDENGVSVETVLHHAGGEDMSLGTLYVPANKRDAQGFGSAVTYAKRYALQTAFGVPTEDDDGNAATASAPATTVSEQQLHALQDAANTVGADLQRFCAYFKVPSLKAIPAGRFDEALAALNAKAKKEPGNA